MANPMEANKNNPDVQPLWAWNDETVQFAERAYRSWLQGAETFQTQALEFWNAELHKSSSQTPPALWRIGDLPALTALFNRNIKLGLRRIDSCRQRVSLCHLRRPCLVKRTIRSGNHPGPMKTLTTISLRSSQKRLRAQSIRSTAALPRMAVRGRAFLSEHPKITNRAITRAQ